MLRGLDIERSIVLVDELQNGDRHLAKTLMSRFCASSKVAWRAAWTGADRQPYVDWRSNALTRIKETYRLRAAGRPGPAGAQLPGAISTRADEL